jgi:CDP-diacylglycerol--glycerol-3-phosphate 3-phosphatidyltransferase
MDPIADKFLIISALVVLLDQEWLKAWVVIIIIVREFLITALRVVALSKDIIIKAEMGGKIKTATQITGIICLLLPRDFLGIDLWGLDIKDIGTDAIYISLVLAVVSGVQYTIAFWKKICF